MLVYGDHHQRSDGDAALDVVARLLSEAGDMPAGVARHAKLVAALIEAGRLLQGIADADFAESGCDRETEAARGIGAFVYELARAVVRSWDTALEDPAALPRPPRLRGLPREVELRVPEGFAFYAVYPEAFIDAARALDLSGRPRVIGIRSIGTTLGAVAAAALDAAPPLTVRPFGDPFARTTAVDRELGARLLDGDAHFVIVDEGPGQSGSSFGAVADWLDDRSVPLARISFLPSHGGPLGSQSSARHRKRWSKAQRIAGDFGDSLADRLQAWASAKIGVLDAPLMEISGGEWRPRFYSRREDWPAVASMWERRKFLGSVGGQPVLFKFAGLGGIGERKLDMARALAAEDLSPEPVGLVHGFLVERWHAEARPQTAADKPIGEIGHYIGTRARLFPAADESGASLGALLQMSRRNIALGLDDKAARHLDAWGARVQILAPRIRRTRTDNRMLPHEWLRLPGGHLLKSDAVDHYQGHDLIGCQDMAWDIAGAISEFDLDDHSAGMLTVAAEFAGERTVDRALLALLRLNYAAFRLGQAVLAAESCADPAAAQRLQATAELYKRQLAELLHQHH